MAPVAANGQRRCYCLARGRPRPFTSGFSRPGAGRFRSGESSQSGRHFGALSVSSQSGGDSENHNSRHLVGACAVSRRHRCRCFALSALTANTAATVALRAPRTHARAHAAPTSSDRASALRASEGIMSSSGGPGGGGDSPTTPSRAALQVTDLERMGCPTKVSTLPSRRADAHAAALEKRSGASSSKPSSPPPFRRAPSRCGLCARQACHGRIGTVSRFRLRHLTAVARATTGER